VRPGGDRARARLCSAFWQAADVVRHGCRLGRRIGPRAIRKAQLVVARPLMTGPPSEHAIEAEGNEACHQGQEDHVEKLETLHRNLRLLSRSSAASKIARQKPCSRLQPKPSAWPGPGSGGIFMVLP